MFSRISGPLLALVWLLALSEPSAGQESFAPPVHPVQLKAVRTTHKIIIDGQLNEQDWLNAAPIGVFTQMEPHQGQLPVHLTEVKVLFDSTTLYIGAFCRDSIASPRDITVQGLARDFNFQSGDVFGVRIDAFNGKRNCLGFDTNPYGVQRDIQSFDAQLVEINWNALWKVKTSIHPGGWVAEMAIPFRSIRYPKKLGNHLNRWGMTFVRSRRKDNEISTFPGLPRSAPLTRMGYAAEVSGLITPDPPANIQVQPYALYANNRTQLGDSLSKSSKAKVGLDLKWAFNSHAQVD